MFIKNQLISEHIANITINRPDLRNALSTGLLEEFRQCLERLKNNSDLSVLIITGEGDKAFCGGADLTERLGMNEEQSFAFVKKIQKTFEELAQFPIPTIAAINGAALGGGLELALACDIRVASHHAILGLSECAFGIIPGAGGTQRLPRLIGPGKAAELIFSAKSINADRALAIGLVNHVASKDETSLDLAIKIAKDISKNAPLSLQAAKKALYGTGLKDGLEFERSCYEQILYTKDRKEGLLAFKEKRLPQFKGE